MPAIFNMLKSALSTAASTAPGRHFHVIGGFAVLLIGAVPIAHAESDAAHASAASAETQIAKRPAARHVGDTTTSLLAAQADGSIAGPGLPMLGATGNLSWQRYLDSFKYRIPENFTNRINQSGDQ